MARTIWHHVIVSDDAFDHAYGRPTDCYCEPEVTDLGGGHRVVRHQDMSRKEAIYGAR